MVGTRGKPLRKRIDTGQQVIYEHFEVVAGKIGNPVLEIAAGGAVPKERREEADLDPRSGANTPRQRAQPFRCARFHEPVHEIRITRLQRLVIAALIREKKVAPAQLVEHALRRQARRTQRRFAFNRREALRKGFARSRDGRRIGRHHRQRQATAEQRAQHPRIGCFGLRVRGASAGQVVALGQRASQQQCGVGIAPVELASAREELRRCRQVASLAQESGKGDHRAALVRIEGQRAA